MSSEIDIRPLLSDANVLMQQPKHVLAITLAGMVQMQVVHADLAKVLLNASSIITETEYLAMQHEVGNFKN